MNQEITIHLNNARSPDETAMLLEVVAGEIRNGRDCGSDPECSWRTQQVSL
jgi:hypothetical protein